MSRLLLVLLMGVVGCATRPLRWNHWRYEAPSSLCEGQVLITGVKCFVAEQLTEHILLYHSGCIQQHELFPILICPSFVSVPGSLLMSTTIAPKKKP